MLMPCLIDTNILIYALTSNAAAPILARIDTAIASLSIKLPDAIIAASALTANLPLLTRNTSDFLRIAELQTINPFID